MHLVLSPCFGGNWQWVGKHLRQLHHGVSWNRCGRGCPASGSSQAFCECISPAWRPGSYAHPRRRERNHRGSIVGLVLTQEITSPLAQKHLFGFSVALGRFACKNSSRATSRRQRLAHIVSASSGQTKTSIFTLNEKPDRKLFTDANSAPPPSQRDSDIRDLKMDPDHRSGYIALVGKPNVGKSTLLNQMIGQKLSIVTHKPQTTRHRILGICSSSEYQMMLYDTPGVVPNKTRKLDKMMMQNVRSATLDADCVLVVVDSCHVPQQVSDILEDGAIMVTSQRPTLLVLNKKDLLKPGELAKKKEWYKEFGGVDEVIAVSAKQGHGVEEVRKWLVDRLPHGPAYYPKDIVSKHPERFFVAELVREKIFLQYRNEIPYVCQVNVLKYMERRAAKDFIELEVVVEKDSQKGVLIGKEGLALKVLATASRLDIEQFVGKEVYVELKVNVRDKWRENEELLDDYGYSGKILYRK